MVIGRRPQGFPTVVDQAMGDRLYGDVVSSTQPDHPRLARNLLHILTVERTSRAEQLVKGFPKTLEEYKYNVGIIEGLDLAIAAAKAAKEKAEA